MIPKQSSDHMFTIFPTHSGLTVPPRAASWVLYRYTILSVKGTCPSVETMPDVVLPERNSWLGGCGDGRVEATGTWGTGRLGTESWGAEGCGAEKLGARRLGGMRGWKAGG